MRTLHRKEGSALKCSEIQYRPDGIRTPHCRWVYLSRHRSASRTLITRTPAQTLDEMVEVVRHKEVYRDAGHNDLLAVVEPSCLHCRRHRLCCLLDSLPRTALTCCKWLVIRIILLFLTLVCHLNFNTPKTLFSQLFSAKNPFSLPFRTLRLNSYFVFHSIPTFALLICRSNNFLSFSVISIPVFSHILIETLFRLAKISLNHSFGTFDSTSLSLSALSSAQRYHQYDSTG